MILSIDFTLSILIKLFITDFKNERKEGYPAVDL